jgi:hypothetical protein
MAADAGKRKGAEPITAPLLLQIWLLVYRPTAAIARFWAAIILALPNAPVAQSSARALEVSERALRKVCREVKTSRLTSWR